MSLVRQLLILFSLAISNSFIGNDFFAAFNVDARAPLILPLDDVPRNLSGGLRRRQLRDSSVAQMRLHDNLLTSGYYTTRLWIGSPPQKFALIVDTGSTVTYVPCSSCTECGKHQDPRFQPEHSSTYKRVKCSENCDCDPDGDYCTYERHYAELSSSSGILSEDIISFGNESWLPPQRAFFGCENAETGDLYKQRADGIMGLGRGRLSIMDQLVGKGVINNSFSLCYGGMDIGGGAMVLGNIPPLPDMVFAHSDPYRSPYYNIDLREIHVAGKSLNLNPKVFDGKHGTVMDSGTTYAYLPEPAFSAFKDAIMKEVHQLERIAGPDPSYGDICFANAGRDISQVSKTFPVVSFVFGNGQQLTLSPENYLFRHLKIRGAYCLGIFQNANDPTTLLGGIIVRNTLVTYDRANDKIGFWKTNCSELLNRLHFTAIAPAPLVEDAPAFPPVESPQTMFPDKLRIGLITFDMALDTNYSNTRPNFTKLADSIAQELAIDSSQVHFLNFTSTDSGSVIKWAIYPAGSGNYISTATATRIMTRLRDHQLRFPKSLGNFRMVEWKTEQHLKQTHWGQRILIAVVASITSLITVLSLFGIWVLWRNRQKASVSYEPVGAAAPEQELQPLRTQNAPQPNTM